MMLNRTHMLCAMGLVTACGLAGCHRTVVRTNAPAGEKANEGTISSPDTTKDTKKAEADKTEKKEVVVTQAPAAAPAQ